MQTGAPEKQITCSCKLLCQWRLFNLLRNHCSFESDLLHTETFCTDFRYLFIPALSGGTSSSTSY